MVRTKSISGLRLRKSITIGNLKKLIQTNSRKIKINLKKFGMIVGGNKYAFG
jgi:hypothetical protein